MCARDHDALSARDGAGEVVPAGRDDRPFDRGVIEAREAEDLEVVADLFDERLAYEALAIPPSGRDDAEVVAHRVAGRGRRAVRERPADRRDGPVERGREVRQRALHEARGQAGDHVAGVATGCGHIGRKMYHWSGQRRTKVSRPRAIACVARCTSSAACFVRSTWIGA